MNTTTYLEGAAAVGLLYWGFAKESGWKKWALIGVGAYLAYSVYESYSGASGTTA